MKQTHEFKEQASDYQREQKTRGGENQKYRTKRYYYIYNK